MQTTPKAFGGVSSALADPTGVPGVNRAFRANVFFDFHNPAALPGFARANPSFGGLSRCDCRAFGARSDFIEPHINKTPPVNSQ